jgi:tetratricopeptide (TPR) repeat protein
LIGRQFTARRTAGDYERAVVAFQRAITLDPTFAAAYAGLSEAQYLIATDRNELTMGEFGRIQAQLRRAIELGPDLSEAYSERGIERLEYPADFAGAQADLARAIAIEPSSSTNQRRYGFLLRCLGRVQEAIIYGRRATDTDPLDSFAWLHLGESLLASGQYDQARNAFTKIVEINPEDPDGLPTQFNVSLLQGRGEEVLGSVAKLADPTWRLYYTAMAEFTLGHDQDSLRALNELLASGATTPTLSARIADVYAWRGDNQQALAWLDKAGAQNKGAVGCVNTNPLYRRLRGDPRFEAFLRNMGLAKY